MTLSKLFSNKVLVEVGFSEKGKMVLMYRACSGNSRGQGPRVCKVGSKVKKKKKTKKKKKKKNIVTLRGGLGFEKGE